MNTWICIKENMPDIHRRVLVFYDNKIKIAYIGLIMDGNVSWYEEGKIIEIFPSHFMYLPERPSKPKTELEKIKERLPSSRTQDTLESIIDYLILKEKK